MIEVIKDGKYCYKLPGVKLGYVPIGAEMHYSEPSECGSAYSMIWVKIDSTNTSHLTDHLCRWTRQESDTPKDNRNTFINETDEQYIRRLEFEKNHLAIKYNELIKLVNQFSKQIKSDMDEILSGECCK